MTLCAHGQEADKKLLDRLMAQPDRNQLNSMNGKPFVGAGSFQLRDAAGTKAFSGQNKAATSSYGGLRSFFGIKNPWIGKKSADVRTAEVANLTMPGVNGRFETKPDPVRAFADSEKAAAGTGREAPVRAATVEGASQRALSSISDKMKKDLTVDDVREILNKNK